MGDHNEKVQAACEYLQWSTRNPRKDVLIDHVQAAVQCVSPCAQAHGDFVLFIHKWMNTTGVLTNITHRGFRADETAGRDVLFVDGDKGSDYLMYGIKTASNARAHSIGVVTNRRFFCDEELQGFAKLVTWILVCDQFEDQQYRFDEHCPGKMHALPISRYVHFA